MKEKVCIIGSGFSSISAACYLAKEGYEVHVFEKNEQLGGRASQYVKDGFKFDMGPTWYWMPDIFERFFADFGKAPAQYYQLERLSPAYRVYFAPQEYIDIADNLEEIYAQFESIEKGAAVALQNFIAMAKANYEIAIKKLVYLPGLSFTELITADTITEIDQFARTIHGYVAAHFTDPRLRKILEFPVLFLGAKPSNTPLFYAFMNYADFGLGTFYPKGGMRSVVEGMITLAEELGVTFVKNATVDTILAENKRVTNILINNKPQACDYLISGADYAHTESLLSPENRGYSASYWNNRTLAPSALMFYVGLDKKLEHLIHHTLFFDESFDLHAVEIYDTPQWPTKPLFYASFPGKTDETVVPEGCEAAIFLIPLAPDLEDTPELREHYFELIISRLVRLTGQLVRPHILFSKSYCINDFKADYNSYKGNAYGLANTLLQTAFLRPKLKSKKLKNMYFTGQLTVPGPGVPPAIISGKLVADLLIKDSKK